MKKLVIFDLDGTIVNTIADLAASTNHALCALGHPTHTVEQYKFMVGNGINKLFERALPENEKTPENIMRMRQEFISHYDQYNTDKSTPYEGIPELLQQLQGLGIKLAVASNKYHTAAVKIVRHFFPSIGFAAVLGQREGINTKPDPAIVYDILQLTGTKKEDTLYVGDSAVDMQTATSAGVAACGVTWGFRPREELKLCYPDYIVDTPKEVLAIARQE